MMRNFQLFFALIIRWLDSMMRTIILCNFLGGMNAGTNFAVSNSKTTSHENEKILFNRSIQSRCPWGFC